MNQACNCANATGRRGGDHDQEALCHPVSGYLAIFHALPHAVVLGPMACIDDPAISVMTDFKAVVPVTIEPHFRIDAAPGKMRMAGVRLLLVADIEDRITGIITAADILGEPPPRKGRELEISHHELHVDMIMTPLEKVLAVDMFTYATRGSGTSSAPCASMRGSTCWWSRSTA